LILAAALLPVGNCLLNSRTRGQSFKHGSTRRWRRAPLALIIERDSPLFVPGGARSAARSRRRRARIRRRSLPV